jgi:hypothetical protein
LTAIGGSDSHDADARGTGSAIGHPTTVVWAEGLSQRGVLDGIRAGRVFIDVSAAGNRVLDFTAEGGGASAHMGDRLSVASGIQVRFTVRVQHAPGAHLEIIEDGTIADVLGDPIVNGEDVVKEFSSKASGGLHWIRANVRSPEGRLLLIGNPIYLK